MKKKVTHIQKEQKNSNTTIHNKLQCKLQRPIAAHICTSQQTINRSINHRNCCEYFPEQEQLVC